MIYSVQEVMDLYDLYNASWSGAKQNLENLFSIKNYDLEREFLNYLNDIIQESYNGNIDQTELNDLLWFEDNLFIDFYKLNYEDKLITKEELNKLLSFYGIEESEE